jgi:hypothetical protein
MSEERKAALLDMSPLPSSEAILENVAKVSWTLPMTIGQQEPYPALWRLSCAVLTNQACRSGDSFVKATISRIIQVAAEPTRVWAASDKG